MCLCFAKLRYAPFVGHLCEPYSLRPVRFERWIYHGTFTSPLLSLPVSIYSVAMVCLLYRSSCDVDTNSLSDALSQGDFVINILPSTPGETRLEFGAACSTFPALTPSRHARAPFQRCPVRLSGKTASVSELRPWRHHLRRCARIRAVLWPPICCVSAITLCSLLYSASTV